MSSGSGCHHQAHEHRQAVRAVSEVVHSRSRLTFATAVLVAVNLVVTCAVLYFTTIGGENPLRPPEVWRSFVPALGVQTVVNGVILLAFKRTRHVGAGVLVGSSWGPRGGCAVLPVALARGVAQHLVTAYQRPLLCRAEDGVRRVTGDAAKSHGYVLDMFATEAIHS